MTGASDFRVSGAFTKASDSLGVIFGWAAVESIDGQPYIDSQDDLVEVAEMTKALLPFMQGDRKIKIGHDGGAVGELIFSWPLDDEITKAFDISCPVRGVLIGVKVDDSTMRAYKAGKLPGFSIAGKARRQAI